MDFATIGGLLLGIISLLWAFNIEGGSLGSLMAVTSFMIVFGGTLGAVMVSFPLEEFMQMPKLVQKAFIKHKYDSLDLIKTLVGLAEKARREGLLALEDEVRNLDDHFLKKGIMLVIDGTDPSLVRSILETEIHFIEERHHAGALIFESGGGFAPTFGIIGTVMGLVLVLSNLSDAASLGPAIAVAFVATLYGVASANIFWLPIAAKLKRNSKEEMMLREVMLEGILSIQSGDNPRIVEEKLKAFLSPKSRGNDSDKE